MVHTVKICFIGLFQGYDSLLLVVAVCFSGGGSVSGLSIMFQCHVFQGTASMPCCIAYCVSVICLSDFNFNVVFLTALCLNGTVFILAACFCSPWCVLAASFRGPCVLADFQWPMCSGSLFLWSLCSGTRFQ